MERALKLSWFIRKNYKFHIRWDFQLLVEGDFSEIQLETINYHVVNQGEIRSLILENLLNVYPQWQDQYGYSEKELIKYMPNVTSLADFKSILGPHCIHLTDRPRMSIEPLSCQNLDNIL